MRDVRARRAQTRFLMLIAMFGVGVVRCRRRRRRHHISAVAARFGLYVEWKRHIRAEHAIHEYRICAGMVVLCLGTAAKVLDVCGAPVSILLRCFDLAMQDVWCSVAVPRSGWTGWNVIINVVACRSHR